MGVDGGGEVADGEGGCHGGGSFLHEVGGVGTEDVTADDGSAVVLADELDEALGLAHGYGFATRGIHGAADAVVDAALGALFFVRPTMAASGSVKSAEGMTRRLTSAPMT